LLKIYNKVKQGNIIYDINNNIYRYIDWGAGCLKEYCKEKCKKPCGFIGAKYTTPPELNIDQRYNDISFQEIRAHDIWSLGIVLYDWYTIKNDITKEPVQMLVEAHFNTSPSIVLKNDDLRNLTQDKINHRISSINNDLTQKILKLMLRINWKERITNWPNIIKTIT